MYGDAFMSDYAEMMTENFEAFRSAARKFRIQWIIMPWTEKFFVREMRKSGEWCEIYRDRLGLVAVSKAGPNASLCQAPRVNAAAAVAMGKAVGQRIR
jgi:hypothetical protein